MYRRQIAHSIVPRAPARLKSHLALSNLGELAASASPRVVNKIFTVNEGFLPLLRVPVEDIHFGQFDLR